MAEIHAPLTQREVLSHRFFEALANKNYQSLIQLYGQVAMTALQGHQTVASNRWQHRQQRDARRSEREEKMDEFYVPGAGYASPPPPSSLGRRGGMDSAAPAVYASLCREFTTFLNHPELTVETDIKLPVSSSLELTEANHVLRDAVMALTEIRPPSTDFVLYANGSILRNNQLVGVEGTTFATEDNNNNDTEMELLSEPTTGIVESTHSINEQLALPLSLGPPIFDGSVANATPISTTGNGGGGAGTALHAVAALDHPLTMALLLCMGADTRASHTAFRRLVQHEAACNGSIHCLTLLLELGNQYGNEQDGEAYSTTAATAFREPHQCKSPTATRSPDSSMDFSLFSRQPQHNLECSSSSMFSLHPRVAEVTFVPTVAPSRTQTDVVSLLRLYYILSKQTESGALSELEAARTLMQYATLSNECKAALISQCGLHNPPPATVVPVHKRNVPPFFLNAIRNSNGASSDGHGNTPLHWASFKNEAACVSLLLRYHADPNARAQPSGWTPLHDAAYSNGRDAIDLLIAAGACVDARANSGATPLCFAAQEDAAEAAELLLIRGADLAMRCAVGPLVNGTAVAATNARGGGGGAADAALVPITTPTHSRFSGYTPLHYCAHYNAHRAAKVLLQHHTATAAMEIHDLNQRLPIHVAVARGSSDVLRELLRAGARVETRSLHRHHSSSCSSDSRTTPSRHTLSRRVYHSANGAALLEEVEPLTPRRNNARVAATAAAASRNASDEDDPRPASPRGPMTPPRIRRSGRSSSGSTSPVSSPLLRSMIPSQPIQSSKPWNCLTQRSIDECRQLISEVEQNWTPDRHSLFTPVDRRAVAELLRVGKRLEVEGSVSFIDLWPEVLSFCGRGWFEVEEDDTEATDMDLLDGSSALNDDNHPLSLPTFC